MRISNTPSKTLPGLALTSSRTDSLSVNNSFGEISFRQYSSSTPSMVPLLSAVSNRFANDGPWFLWSSSMFFLSEVWFRIPAWCQTENATAQKFRWAHARDSVHQEFGSLIASAARFAFLAANRTHKGTSIFALHWALRNRKAWSSCRLYQETQETSFAVSCQSSDP